MKKLKNQKKLHIKKQPSFIKWKATKNSFKEGY